MKRLKLEYNYEKSNFKKIKYYIFAIFLIILYSVAVLNKYSDQFVGENIIANMLCIGVLILGIPFMILIAFLIQDIVYYLKNNRDILIKNKGQKEKAIINNVKTYRQSGKTLAINGSIEIQTSNKIYKIKGINANDAFGLLKKHYNNKGKKIETDVYIYNNNVYVDLSIIRFGDIIEELKNA